MIRVRAASPRTGVVSLSSAPSAWAKQARGVIALVAACLIGGAWSAPPLQTSCFACDPTFDGDGLALGMGPGFADGVVVQPDGKVLVLVSNIPSVAVERLNEDGSPDLLDFGTLGVVSLSFHPDSAADYPAGIALAPDLTGSPGDFDILVAGWAEVTTTTSSGRGKKNNNSTTNYLAVVRLNSNGTLETGFGADGLVILDPGTRQPWSNAVAVDSQGRILVGAFVGYGGGVFRVNPDGTSVDAFQGVGAPIKGIAVVSGDGVLGLTVFGEVVRWTNAGTLDGTFGTAGEIDVPGDQAQFAVDSDTGWIVVASSVEETSGKGRNRVTTDEVVVSRYDANGAFDQAFVGYDGDAFDQLRALQIDPDGRVVAVVESLDETANSWVRKAVVRWDDTGTGFATSPYFLPADVGTDFENLLIFDLAFGMNSAQQNVVVLGGSEQSDPTRRPAVIRMIDAGF